MKNNLTLAVAGSRKTQGIVDACAQSDLETRILVLTYTVANQEELRDRVSKAVGQRSNIEIMGWFQFLLRCFVGPYIPLLYSDHRVVGFDFESPYQQKVSNDSPRKYFTSEGFVRKVHISQLATKVNEISGGIPIARLECVYDRIYIDEVQDLCGYDLDILDLLLNSNIPLHLVGDVRQAVLVTSDQERRNKKYMFMSVINWFRKREAVGQLEIHQRSESWRCRPEVCQFADSLFGSSWGFDSTLSRNCRVTPHDGIFVVRPSDVNKYVERFSPMVLRDTAASGKDFNYLNPRNFRVAKGLSCEHVLIIPTQPIQQFLIRKKVLDDKQACKLYVAATRAEQSVAFVLADAGECSFSVWQP